MSSVIRIIKSNILMHMKQSFARQTFKYIIIIQPILYSILLYLMFNNSNRPNAGEYLIIGTSILNLWSSIVFSSAGDIERERFSGTLELIYISPTNFKLIILGKVLGNLLLGASSMLISYVTITLIFKVDIYIKHPIIFFITFIISMSSFVAISMLLAALFTLSRNSRLLMNCMEFPIYILCGVIFPINILPEWTRVLSFILSPTWAAKLLRESMIGIDNFQNFYTDLFILILIGVIYFLFVFILFKTIDKRIRSKGTLGVH
ncbi:ABC transporter permease [Bacillus cereus]|uniref:Transport permease protein n=1 Tax=Bacillus cereus HuA2-1 TaxID=1053201 RepID=J9BKN9_BACCE|nr:ABC transporter permease [Bacillus cereus]EJV74122.1 hypothetical protein IG3_05944 [Bacillus cereus HuA2-1]